MPRNDLAARSPAGVTFILGPPTASEQEKIFEAFQQESKAGTDVPNSHWMDCENESVRHLFDRKADEGSIAEEVFRKAAGVELRINDLFVGLSRHRGLMVAALTIKNVHVSASNGSDVSWPPPDLVIQRFAMALKYILEREWIGVLVT